MVPPCRVIASSTVRMRFFVGGVAVSVLLTHPSPRSRRRRFFVGGAVVRSPEFELSILFTSTPARAHARARLCGSHFDTRRQARVRRCVNTNRHVSLHTLERRHHQHDAITTPFPTLLLHSHERPHKKTHTRIASRIPFHPPPPRPVLARLRRPFKNIPQTFIATAPQAT